MKTFEIYSINSSFSKAVKRGWSWPAFFFSIIWSYVVGLRPLFWLLAIISILAVKFAYFGPKIHILMYEIYLLALVPIGISILLGFFGNSLIRSQLENEGYEKIATLKAKSSKVAINMVIYEETTIEAANE